MDKLSILSSDKQRDFDNPSKLNAKKRSSYFSLDHDIMNFVNSLRTPTNQVGFVLQLGYFRANGKVFIQQHQFKSPDIDYVLKMLHIAKEEINLSTYIKKIPTDHRKKILDKMLFYIHIANGIKSGSLNLMYSYRYKAIQHYLIADKIWQAQKTELIKTAGLEEFIDLTNVLTTLEEKLNGKYKMVNEHFLTMKILIFTLTILTISHSQHQKPGVIRY